MVRFFIYGKLTKFMNQKIEYVRYLHQFLLEKNDNRTIHVRDWLYQNSNNIELVIRTDVNQAWSTFVETYSDLLSYEQWVRDIRLNQLLN